MDKTLNHYMDNTEEIIVTPEQKAIIESIVKNKPKR